MIENTLHKHIAETVLRYSVLFPPKRTETLCKQHDFWLFLYVGRDLKERESLEDVVVDGSIINTNIECY
jgi:hypothetical protein